MTQRPIRFLLVVKQKKNVEAFFETLRILVERGHHVTLAVQERDEKRNERLETALQHEQFVVTRCPEVRGDQWADVAALLRRLRDALQYLKPPMQQAAKLRTRVFERLRQELLFEGETQAVIDAARTVPADQVRRLDATLALAESALPSDARFDTFLASHAPDVLLLSPLVHFGPAQSDLVASARARGIPVWMLLYSWDNLSTKGALHRWPDRMFVWNEQQRREARLLHGFPEERVIVAGAPRFDPFFALQPALTRERFHVPLDLDPSQPTLLYLCSSRLVSEQELPFITRWVQALRTSSSSLLRGCNIVVRPHPDIALLPEGTPMPRHSWSEAPHLRARLARPFGDARAIVLMTPHDTPVGLFESITHSTAVVGLNTTAELEAGIVGRPVFTIVADTRDADGQSSTVHFHYLTTSAGGFVATADGFDEHVAQLDTTLQQPADRASIRRFIESFLRPHGIERPVAPLLAQLLEETTKEPGAPHPTPSVRVGMGGDAAAAALADRDRPTLPLTLETPAPLAVYATRIARQLAATGALRLDPAVTRWIDREVELGDVVYDIGAGIGEYVLVAASRRGALVVAFEPGYTAHGELCDNVLLNGCEASVVPIPLALAGRDGLAELKYEHGRPGDIDYVVRDDIEWRVKHRPRNKPYLQPAMLVRLDTLVERQRLPSPHHIRLSNRVSAPAVLTGARETLRAPGLRTICLSASPSSEQAARVLAELGWARDDGDVNTVVFRRPPS